MSAARKKEEWTATEAAAFVGVHPRTMLNWIKEAVAGSGTQVRTVRVDLSRKVPRYYVDAGEVRQLAAREAKDYF